MFETILFWSCLCCFFCLLPISTSSSSRNSLSRQSCQFRLHLLSGLARMSQNHARTPSHDRRLLLSSHQGCRPRCGFIRTDHSTSTFHGHNNIYICAKATVWSCFSARPSKDTSQCDGPCAEHTTVTLKKYQQGIL